MRISSIFVVIVMILLVGCGSSQKAPETTQIETSAQKKSAEVSANLASRLVQQRAPWIPSDTTLLVVADSEALELLVRRAMPRDKAEEGVELFRKNLTNELFPGLELDVFEAETMIYAVGPSSVTLIFNGDLSHPTGVEKREVDGREVYVLDSIHDSVTELDRRFNPKSTTTTRMMSISDPPGAVLHIDSSGDKADWPQNLESLSDAGLARFTELLELAPRATLVGVTVNGGKALFEVRYSLEHLWRSDYPVPDEIVVGMGPVSYLGIRGDESILSSTEENLDKQVSIVRASFENEWRSRFDLHPYLADLKKEKGSSRLVYSLPLSNDFYYGFLTYEELGMNDVPRELEMKPYPDRESQKARGFEAIKARGMIKKGTKLERSMVETGQLDQRLLRWNPVLPEDIDQYIGKRVLRDINRGPILEADFEDADREPSQ